MNDDDSRAGRKPCPAYHQTRNPVTHSGRGFRAKFFSAKNRRLVRCESLLERDALFLLEFARGIRSYEEQPVTVKYLLSGRNRQYTPDFGITWEGGPRWFIEVKPSEKLTEPSNTEKFDTLTHWFAARGDRLLVLTEQQIRRTIRLRQIRDLLRGRVTPNSDEANALLPKVGIGTPISDMCVADTDVKLIFQLLANRSVTCDLDSVIHGGTIIRPYEEADDVALFF